MVELGAVKRAEQAPGGSRGPALVAAARPADLEPAAQRVLGLGVQADRALLVALRAAHADDGLVVLQLDVLRAERERLVDPQPGAPEREDQRAVAHAGRRATRATVEQRPDVLLFENLRGPERVLVSLPGHCGPLFVVSVTPCGQSVTL